MFTSQKSHLIVQKNTFETFREVGIGVFLISYLKFDNDVFREFDFVKLERAVKDLNL